MLVSLVPLLIALQRTTALRAAGWLALVWALAFHAISLSWLTTIFGASVPAILAITALPWYLFGVGYRFVQRNLPRAAVLVAPILWVAVDWLRCEGWYFEFSWAQLGFAHVAPATLYRFIGVYGLTFVIVGFNAIGVEVVRQAPNWRRFSAIAAIVAVVTSVLPMTVDDAVVGEHSAAVVQQGHGDLETLERLTREAAEKGADLIAWPETAVRTDLLDHPDLRTRLADLARDTGATLVVGGWARAPEDAPIDWLRRRAMEASGNGMLYNAAMVIAPDGEILGSYHKTHPIQFFADGVPGDSYPVFDTPAGRIGVAICYDFDYASTSRRLIERGAEVLVVPTVDSEDWPVVQHRQHAHMARVRAAEAACPVIRPAAYGISQILTPTGQVTATITSGEAGIRVARYQIVRAPRPAITWPWLPHVCLGVSLLLVALAIRARWGGSGRPVANSRP